MHIGSLKHKETKMNNGKIFNGNTAWFSSSVSQKVKNLWKRNGGQMSPLDSAMFIFSRDFTALDTLQIFSSEAYLDEHLAVIHPMYISDSVTKGSKTVLMQYKLPPEEVYQATKDKQVYKWDRNSDLKNEQQQVRTGRQTCRRAKLCLDENTGNESEGAKTRRRQGPSYTDSENDSSVTMTTERQQSAVVPREVLEDMCHIDDIPKITGVLEEFIPGKNGCEVFKK